MNADPCTTIDVEAVEIHPAAHLFPPLTGDEFDSLVKDIRKNGLRQPVLLLEGKLIDGRNRLFACRAPARGIDGKPLDFEYVRFN